METLPLLNPINYECIEYMNALNEKVYAVFMSVAYVNPYHALLERFERAKLINRN